MNKTIVLGSKSSGRKKILTQMGYRFSVMDPNINEKSIRNKDPKKLVLALAQAKADALLPKIKEPTILITADQVVLCNSTILEKPKDKNEAKSFLKLYTNNPVKTVTAVTITNTKNKNQQSGIDIATIWFDHIPKNMIEKLAEQETALNCAGGFTIDSPILKKYITKIEGTKDSIMGLPIKLTEKLITQVS